MEISRRIDALRISGNKISKKQEKASSEISFRGATADFSDISASLGKAKISMDNTYSKPIPYEEKIEILNKKEFKDADIERFLKLNDENFKKAIQYLDLKLSAPEIEKLLDWENSESEIKKKGATLAKSGVPFTILDNLVQRSNLSIEMLETLGSIDFDKDYSGLFPMDNSEIVEIFSNDSKYDSFVQLLEKGVDARIAVGAIVKSPYYRKDYIEKLFADLEKNNGLSPSMKVMLNNLHFSDEEIEKLKDVSKKYNINQDDYEKWYKILARNDIKRAEHLLELGLPLECLEDYIRLDDNKIKEVIQLSKELKIPTRYAIMVHQNSYSSDEEKRRICELLKDPEISPNVASRLASFNDEDCKEAIGYLKRGININDAIIIVNSKRPKEDKEKMISLLGTFQYASDIINYLDMNLSEEESEKFLKLVGYGLYSYSARICIESENLYKKVVDLMESGVCKSLKALTVYSEEDIDTFAKFSKLGVPEDDISLFSMTAKEDEIAILEAGVSYEDLRAYNRLDDSSQKEKILPFMKKGLCFKEASRLADMMWHYRGSVETLLDNVSPELSACKIYDLAEFQKEKGKDWAVGKEKELFIEFAKRVDNLSKLEFFKEKGFLTEEVLKNFIELTKRGVAGSEAMDALVLSKLDFKDSAQFDRAAELLKRGVNFIDILCSMNDDKIFLEAAKNGEKKSYYRDATELNVFLMECYKKGFNKAELKHIEDSCLYMHDHSLLYKFLNAGHSAKDIAILSRSSYLFSKESDEEKERMFDLLSGYVLKGCDAEELTTIYSNEKQRAKFEEYVAQGIEPAQAQIFITYKIFPNETKKIERFYELKNSNVHETLKKTCGNPAMGEYIDYIYNFSDYDPYRFRDILDSNATIDDIINSGKIFVKSPLKQAMKRPNLYLANIPIEHTEKVNGEYPKLSPKDLKEYQEKMLKFFRGHMLEITRALKFLDVDTFNQLMDKRTQIFSEQLDMLNRMNDKHYSLVSKITKCRKPDGKMLSSKEKIELAKIVLYHQLGYLDIQYLEDMVKTGIVDLDELHKSLFGKLTEVLEITPEQVEEHKDKLDLDSEYMFLLLRTQKSAEFLDILPYLKTQSGRQEMLNDLQGMLEDREDMIHNGFTEETCKALIELVKQADGLTEQEIYKKYLKIPASISVDLTAQSVLKMAILEDFRSKITDSKTEFGEVNKKTQAKFEKEGIDYVKWLDYKKEDEIDISGKKYDIKMWDRKPQKDLFMGNRTSCCTAIIDGGNGKATPIYLTSTAINVVQLQDKEGNILGMSRIFVGKVDNKPSIIVENIELNSAFAKDKSEDELKKLREGMLGYIKELAGEISSVPLDVYFSANYTHVPHDDLEKIEKNIEFVGDITSNSVYLNCAPGWVEVDKLKDKTCEVYKIA